MSDSSSHTLSKGEFIAIVALMSSLVAMSIDAMLPALRLIGDELSVANANDTQLVVSSLFLGLAVGQLFFGPLSDSLGRKRTFYMGSALFCLGTLISLFAPSFTVLLLGRVLQGIGAAAPRLTSLAVVRDLYAGRGMAQIMSTVNAVFILVPAIAPAIGQGILAIADWRAIFAMLLAQGALATLWFGIRQPETLPAEKRLPLSARRIANAVAETCRTRATIGFTLTSGLVFGAFLGYLSTAQQIFDQIYNQAERFPLYFGALALAIGFASVVNARLVVRLGMRILCIRALWSMTLGSAVFFPIAWHFGGTPPLWLLMTYLVVTFFGVGILFGNLNALAMEPVGHIAGTAASVITSIATVCSVGFGIPIGRLFDGTVLPLIGGFAVLGTLALLLFAWTARVAHPD